VLLRNMKGFLQRHSWNHCPKQFLNAAYPPKHHFLKNNHRISLSKHVLGG
jgi:hypothetical protein